MTKLPDDDAVGVTVAVIGVLLIVLLVDPVVVGPVVVVSGTVDDVGCLDSVVVVTVVGSVTGAPQNLAYSLHEAGGGNDLWNRFQPSMELQSILGTPVG